LALVAFAAPIPAAGQYFPPALIIVPPPAQNYATPKSEQKPAADKPKTSDADAADGPKGRYQGRTFIPD
jgi:hypothetical protein